MLEGEHDMVRVCVVCVRESVYVCVRVCMCAVSYLVTSPNTTSGSTMVLNVMVSVATMPFTPPLP